MLKFEILKENSNFRQQDFSKTQPSFKVQKNSRLDLHRYPAKMLGRIAEDILNKYGKPAYAILDPFCGLSRVLVKAQERGMNSIGIDINPLAVLISRVKLARYNVKKLKLISKELIRKIKQFQGHVALPQFDNINYWFDKKVQKELIKILTCIKKIKKGKIRDFFLVCFSSIVRKVSNADPNIPPPVFSKKVREVIKKRKINVIKTFEKEIKKNLKLLNNSKKSDVITSKVLIGDAREIHLPDESVDLVITSPPYMDAQKYVRTLSLELLWTLQLSRKELINLDKKIIGTDRILRKDVKKIGINLADKYVDKIMKSDRNRALILYEYLIQMKKSIEEIYRVLKTNRVFGLVIGNNTVKGIKVPFHKILSQIAKKIGFKIVEKRRDKIKYRGFMLKRNKTGGLIDSEWILIFRKE